MASHSCIQLSPEWGLLAAACQVVGVLQHHCLAPLPCPTALPHCPAMTISCLHAWHSTTPDVDRHHSALTYLAHALALQGNWKQARAGLSCPVLPVRMCVCAPVLADTRVSAYA